MRRLVAAVNASPPTIGIQAEVIRRDIRNQQRPAQVAPGRAPDIARANEPDISKLAASATTDERTPALLPGAKIDPKRFIRLLNTGSSGDKMSGLGHHRAAFVVHSNKDLLAQAGATQARANRAEFLAAPPRCPGASRPATWGMGVPIPHPVLIQNGGAPTDRAGHHTTDTAARSGSAFTFLTGLVTRHQVPPTNASEASGQTTFRPGKTCFTTSGR